MKEPVKSLVFPNEPFLRSLIVSGKIQTLISLPTDEYRSGDQVLMIPKNIEPWEEKAFLATISQVRNVEIGDILAGEIESCGFRSRKSLVDFYRRFIEDLRITTPVLIITWTNATEVDSADYGYSAPYYGNQNNSSAW